MIKSKEDIRSVIKQMTLEEKIAQLHAAWLEISADGSAKIINIDKDTRLLDIDELIENGLGHLSRPLGSQLVEAEKGIRGLNAFQHRIIKQSRFAIPALVHEESLTGLMAFGATLFCSALNYGSTWDPALVQKGAASIGAELHAVGARLALAPVLDVARDARWGRCEESFGEDPYLVGSMATAYVKGLQGPNRRLLATLKHYVGHSFSEGGRNHAPVRIGARELNDVFLFPFEMAVKYGNAGALMPAYHDIDGEPSSASYYYITELLRQQWGFDGLVVSDYEAIKLLETQHRTAKNRAEAAAQALLAGMDVELPNYSSYKYGLLAAVDQGLVAIQDIDQSVSRVLLEKLRLGIFTQPYKEEQRLKLNSKESRELATELAAKSLILLRNEGAILPLDRSKKQKIALLGTQADDQFSLFSAYSFPVHLRGARKNHIKYAKTLYETMSLVFPKADIDYQEACKIIEQHSKEAAVFPSEDVFNKSGQNICSTDRSKIPAAVESAKNADIAIITVGDLSGLFRTGTVGEGSDADSLDFPGLQSELLEKVLATGTPTIVIILSGRPYSPAPQILAKTAAIIEAWLPGQEGAQVIAETLAGMRNPGGKLNVSVPKSAGAMPFFYNHKFKSGGTPIQENFGALYPFGFGLTYTSFSYSNFSIAQKEQAMNGEFILSCDIRNTGAYAGDEVVQLYARNLTPSLVQPIIELKGFIRLSLGIDECKRVCFKLPTDLLSFTKNAAHRVIEAGEFDLSIGSSSQDIRFKDTVKIIGSKDRILSKNWRMICAVELASV